MAGPGGFQVSGTGHLPASVAVWKDGFRTPWQAMAGHGRPWQARRAPPEAVPVGKRRDPPLPVKAITGTGHTSKATGDSTARASLGEPGGQSVDAGVRRPARTRRARCRERMRRCRHAVPDLASRCAPCFSGFQTPLLRQLPAHPCSRSLMRNTTSRACQWSRRRGPSR